MGYSYGSGDIMAVVTLGFSRAVVKLWPWCSCDIRAKVT